MVSLQLISTVNDNNVLRCSSCGRIIKKESWWFNVIVVINDNSFFEVSVCRSCADTSVCDIMKRIKERKVFWCHKKSEPLKTFILEGGFAATLDQHLAGETKNGSTC